MMGLVTLTADTWTEIAPADTPVRVRVRSVEPTPAIWIVEAASAPADSDPPPGVECEQLDADKRETAIGNGGTGCKVFARVRGRGLVNRLIVSPRLDGLS